MSIKNGSVKEREAVVSVGKYLQMNRLEKQLTVEDVVKAIYISADYIKALESEEYHLLPERTYALGYLRSYANFLGLAQVEDLVKKVDSTYNFEDPHYEDRDYLNTPLDERYSLVYNLKKSASDMLGHGKSTKHMGHAHSDKNKELSASNNAYKHTTEEVSLGSKNNKSVNLLFLVALAVIIIGLVLIISYAFKDSDSTSNEETIPISKDDRLQSIMKSDQFVIVDSNAREKDSNNKEMKSETVDSNIKVDEAKSVQEQEDPVKDIIYSKWPKETIDKKISITFKEDVWVQIYKTEDSKIVYLDKIFTSGSVYEIPGVEGISMNVGNYKAVSLLVDGKDLFLKSNKRRSVVLSNIPLDVEALLKTYAVN